MKRIVYFVDGLDFGGVEKVTLMLSEYFRKKAEVYIISLYSDKKGLVSLFPKEVLIEYLPFTSSRRGLLFYALYWVTLYRKLKRISPDIIHAHNSSFSFFYLVSVARVFSRQIPIVRTFHFMGSFLCRKKKSDRIRFLIDKYATILSQSIMVAVSPVLSNSLKKLYDIQNIVCVPNGIDVEFDFNPSRVSCNRFDMLKVKSETMVVIYVARMVEGKNHCTLIKAWQLVVSEYSNAMLLLVGDGELKAKIEAEVERRGLLQNVKFTGAVANVSDYLSMSDIAVFPSLSEGFGLVLMEEMAMQLPIVVSKIPAFLCLVENNSTALFYETMNARDLADKILLLLNNKNLRIRIGKNAREFVKSHYSLEKMCCRYERVYESILCAKT